MILRIIAYIIRKLMISPLEFFNTIFQNLALFPEQKDKFILLVLGLYEVLLNTVLLSYVNWKTFGLYTIVKLLYCNTLGMVLLGFFILLSNNKYRIDELYDIEEISETEDISEKKGDVMYTTNKLESNNGNSIESDVVLSKVVDNMKVDFDLTKKDCNNDKDNPVKRTTPDMSSDDEEDELNNNVVNSKSEETFSSRAGLDMNVVHKAQSILADDILDCINDTKIEIKDIENDLSKSDLEDLSLYEKEVAKEFSNMDSLTNFEDSQVARRRRHVKRVVSRQQAIELKNAQDIFKN